MAFFIPEHQQWVDMLPGIRRRHLAHGERGHTIFVEGKAGAEVPEHSHPHEQLGFVIEGELEFTIGDAAPQRISAGTGYAIPGDVPHRVLFLVDSTVIDIFVPVREEYLPPEHRS